VGLENAARDTSNQPCPQLSLVEDDVMLLEVAQLEQAWLQAEAIADEAKKEAERASQALSKRNGRVVDASEVKVLLTSVQQAKQRQEEAELVASDAFDRFWQAKDQRQVNA
jgi:hypothetical protein